MRLQRAQLTLRAVWLEADLVFFPAPLPPAFRSSIRRSPNSMRRMILNRKSRPETVPHLNGRSIPMNMGKVLGGGSSINVMTWARGHKNDWDYFASEAGDSAWSYESVLNIYRRIEDWHGAPNPKYRGTGGRFLSDPRLTPTQLLRPCLKERARSGSQLLKIRTVA